MSLSKISPLFLFFILFVSYFLHYIDIVNAYSDLSNGEAVVGNFSPQITTLQVEPNRTDICYNISFTIVDENTLNDLTEITITVWEQTTSTYSSPDNPANHFTFKWTPESGWSEVSLSGYLVDSVEPSDLSVTEGVWSIKAMFDTSESVIGNYTIRVFVSDQVSSISTDAYVVYDKLFVSFFASDMDPLIDTSVSISWTITRLFDNSEVTDFVISITKDGELWKSGLTVSSVTDVSGVGSHTYDVYSVTDNTYGLTVFQSTPVTVTWHAQSVTEPTEYTGVVPPVQPYYLDVVVEPVTIYKTWWQPKCLIHATAINKGTLGADFTFEYRILDERGNVVFYSTQTIYIGSLEEKTLNITVLDLPDGEYTLHVQSLSPIKVGSKTHLIVQTPFYGSPLFLIVLLIALIALIILFIKGTQTVLIMVFIVLSLIGLMLSRVTYPMPPLGIQINLGIILMTIALISLIIAVFKK